VAACNVFASDTKQCCEVRDVSAIMLSKKEVERKLARQVYFEVAFFWLQ
jgi:hypothetical protein